MSTTAVIMSEVLKFLACFLIIFIKEGSLRAFLSHLNENIIKQPMDCIKISVPSIIYTLQNNLLFVAVSNLDAAVFQVS
jgi:UDP-sugar transporter A1/2/3